ncbi:type VII secretion protein EccCa [Actinoplanes sp. NPDC051851]|uniref:type VII secretion protein EccCa n=1 Tax=Actinoplanes sp. NPDC051851 TaxID=3154753 RepID=UPI00342EEB52
MGTTVIRRAERRAGPAIPTGELTVDPPPALAPPASGRWRPILTALPLLGGTVAMAMMAGRGGGTYSYVVGGLFGISSLAMLGASFGSTAPRRAEARAARRDYLRHLAALRRRARENARRQRAGMLYRHPDPAGLWSTVASHRLWERRPEDPDFGVARIGLGPQTLATPLRAPETRPLDELEPMTAGALRRFLDAYAVVPGLPVAVALRSFARVHVRGPGAADLVRAMLVQLAVFHAPDDLRIAVCAGPGRQHEWEWVKWLPHAGHPARADTIGPLRLLAGSAAELDRLLADVTGDRGRFRPDAGAVPHLVLIRDGAGPALIRDGAGPVLGDEARDGVTVLDLDTAPGRLPDRVTLVLSVAADGALTTSTMDRVTEAGRADALPVPVAEAIARRLAPLRLSGPADQAGSPVPSESGLAELLGIADPETFTAAAGWRDRAERDRLRVPIGVGPEGVPVELDLKESAQGGMGPHGLVVGATGSGKSELLRTLVLALAATHSSETLNFVLIDFKGGAGFAALDRLPHTAALITNLEDALPMVDRMADAIDGELVRRQELLRRAGNHSGLRDYEQARAAGAALPPLPSLLVVCDEFTELLQRKPELIELFLQIGRLGRSLGVHLLLASQRMEEGRLRGLDTHLSYRIGLRTFNAMESRVVLGVPDAHELPNAPGHGYLRIGTAPLARFRVAYASGPPRPPGPVRAAPEGGPRVLPYAALAVVPPGPPALPARPSPNGASLLTVLAGRLAGQGPPAHRVWLPPLDRPATLDDLLGPLAVDAERGLTVANPALRGALQVPIALVDKPREQRRDVHWLQLAGAGGHVAVVGGTLSGKSTALRSLICGLALTHTPAEVRVYALDFGGGSLGALAGLPHVGGVFGRLEAEGVRRTVGEMVTLLAEREQSGGRDPRRADVFLVVDGWATVRADYEELEPALIDLATRGLSYGIHLVAAASRWMDFRPALRDLFGSRVELRLGDPADSMVGRRAALTVPEGRPGRGVLEYGLHLLTVLPELTLLPELADGGHAGTERLVAGMDGLVAGMDGLVEAVAAAWTGEPAPRVRLLPGLVSYAEIREAGAGLSLPIGLAETDLRPVLIDVAAEPHFLLFGDAECGKTGFLRGIAATVTTRFTPEQARVILVDYRRGLADLPETPHRIGYGVQARRTLELMESVAGYMARRLPGPDVPARQLRERTWWTGPELFVLVDDYDLVTAGPVNPLHPLLDYLAQARDIGLHLMLTRRAGGAARALYEPVIQRLRELSVPGLVMAGPPEEGALIGTVRPERRPPGRGVLVTRRAGARLIQLAHLPPTDSQCD